MTYEDALDHAQRELDAYAREAKYGKAFFAKYAEFWKICVESIEKQVQKKPLNYGRCPCCDWEFPWSASC